MKFVKVNYSLNQTYHVENVAFEELVKNVVKQIKGIKLINVTVEVDQTNNDFLVTVEVNKGTTSYSNAASKIQNAIEEYSLNLIQTKPRNIKIVFKDKEVEQNGH